MSFRIEKKFRVEQKKLVKLYSWLKTNKALKIYNDRYVKSIYFDNNKFSSYHDSIEGVVPRKKIRLRNYSKDKSNFDNLKLEIKINSIEGRYKTSEKLKTYKNYFNNGIHDNFYGLCYPKIIVSYKREYYRVYGYRITLDREIEYDNFNLKNFFLNTINENRIIVELKTNINSSENDINEKFPFEIIRFSKYCFGIEKLYKNLISG